MRGGMRNSLGNIISGTSISDEVPDMIEQDEMKIG
jgi:hypothetical protein